MTRQLVPDPLLKRLDWAAALEETMSPRGEFFPSRVEAHAADVDRGRTLKLLDARLRKGRGLALAEGVAVPRRRLLTAVAHDIPFLDRVVVSALALETMRTLEPDVDALAIHLSMTGPQEGDRAEFEQRPLTHEDAGAFVRSDVSAFYDYVDQDLLAVEIAELTGDVDLADATAVVLHRLLGRGLGLPQGPRGADVFADLFLSDVDRRISRAGIHSARLRDEYILATADDATARRALRVLEDALRERGLGLNAGKTQILSRTDYETGMSVKSERMTAAVMEEAALAGYDFDPDAFEEIDWSDLDVGRAEEMFTETLEDEEAAFGGFGRGELGRGLIALGATHSTLPLEHLRTLVGEHGGLSREISFYLRQLGGTPHEMAALEAVSELLRREPFIHAFTEGWLLDFLARSNEEFPPGTIEFLQSSFSDNTRPWFARGRAAIALARKDALPEVDVVDDLFVRAPETARADIAAAVELQGPSWRASFRKGLGASPLLRAIPELLRERGAAAI
jgi:hypothetical protein